jgi:hypothetical protein
VTAAPPGHIPVSELLDDGAEVALRVATPWVGLLWLTSLPLRFLQAHFAARILDLGADAAQYGDYLRGLALGAMGALLLSSWGRAVYVRACGLGLRSEDAPGPEALRIAPVALAGYVYLALMIEVLFFALAITGLAIPLLVVAAGVAAAAHPHIERPGLLAPLRAVAPPLAEGRALTGLVFVFAVAFVAALANLYFVFQLGRWLAGGVPGLDPAVWDTLLSPGNARFVLVLVAGAILAVEPFWLAALTVLVHRARSRETGEDLRLRFERLRRREAA